MGWVNELYREVTSLKSFDVPEVLEVHEVPSVEVRMVPEAPATTKVLFAKVTPRSHSDVPDVLADHVMPSDEVRMVPDSPTAIKVLLT